MMSDEEYEAFRTSLQQLQSFEVKSDYDHYLIESITQMLEKDKEDYINDLIKVV